MHKSKNSHSENNIEQTGVIFTSVPTASKLDERSERKESYKLIADILLSTGLQLMPIWMLLVITIFTQISLSECAYSENINTYIIVSGAALLYENMKFSEESLAKKAICIGIIVLICASTVLYTLEVLAENYKKELMTEAEMAMALYFSIILIICLAFLHFCQKIMEKRVDA